MKILAFCLVMMLLSTFTSVANSKNVINLSKNNHLLSGSYNLGGIFYSDDENNILFIDFEVIEDNLALLQVFKDKEVLLKDDLYEISADFIYELNMNQFGPGFYTIEIQTEKGIKIQKEIVVN